LFAGEPDAERWCVLAGRGEPSLVNDRRRQLSGDSVPATINDGGRRRTMTAGWYRDGWFHAIRAGRILRRTRGDPAGAHAIDVRIVMMSSDVTIFR
jgi:hypothetical protein